MCCLVLLLEISIYTHFLADRSFPSIFPTEQVYNNMFLAFGELENNILHFQNRRASDEGMNIY